MNAWNLMKIFHAYCSNRLTGEYSPRVLQARTRTRARGGTRGHGEVNEDGWIYHVNDLGLHGNAVLSKCELSAKDTSVVRSKLVWGIWSEFNEIERRDKIYIIIESKGGQDIQFWL